MKYEDLKNGEVYDQCLKNLDEENPDCLIDLFNILRDSTVLVPLFANLSKEDQQYLADLAKNSENEDEILNRELHFDVDILTNAENEKYFPVFTSESSIPSDYPCSPIYEHFADVLISTVDQDDLAGIVVNPFTTPITIKKEIYELFGSLTGVVETKQDDPFIKLINEGCKYYEKDNLVDYKVAEEIFLTGSKLGISDCNSNLGYIYMYGKSGKKDRDLGFSYFSKAAKQGNIDGLMKVADDYRKGEFNEKNEKLAFEIYDTLADRIREENNYDNYCEVYLRLAKCYEKGIGCDIDYAYATNYADTAYNYMNKHKDVWYYKQQAKNAKELRHKCYKKHMHDFTLKPLVNHPLFYPIYINYSINKSYEGIIVMAYLKGRDQEPTYRIMCSATFNEQTQKLSKIYVSKRELSYQEIKDYQYLNLIYRLTKEAEDEMVTAFTKFK